jgi:peptidoglycan-N-acetylglucosamine deacetylase
MIDMKINRIYIIAFFTFAMVSCGNNEQDATDVNNTTDTVKVPDTNAAAVDTVNAPRLVTASADGSLLLTAETGKGVGPNIKYMPEWRAFGWFTSSDSVVWDVEVNESGAFDATLEWSVDDKEAGKEFVLRSGDEQLEGTVAKSGSWETFKTEKIGTLNLKSGRQTVVFKSKKEFSKDGALLDLRNLKLTKK